MQTSVGLSDGTVTVPPPVAPDDSAAWYAPNVCAQYEIHPGVVTTIRQTTSGCTYEVREPQLTGTGTAALERVTSYFSAVSPERPLTRAGVVDRMRSGFIPKYERVIDRSIDLSHTGRRRLDYHALASIRCFGDLTPHALDDRIESTDLIDGELVVRTPEYVATTGITATPYGDRLTNERVRRCTVSFLDFEIPVVVYRDHANDADPFTTKYAVLEPDLLPGDADLIEACKKRLWETNVDSVLVSRAVDPPDPSSTIEGRNRITFVRERAEALLSRRLTARNMRTWFDSIRHRTHAALAEYDLLVGPVSDRFDPDRLTDLLYYVLRDYVGYGRLTIPIHDGQLEDIETNRVGDRIKVVPRGIEERIPTNLVFENEDEFVNVVTQLAAADGVELNASTPSAKVNLDPVGITATDETIRCAVALPIISEDGPHISIRKQSSDPLTPVDLVRNGSVPTAFVALLWLLFEHHGVVLFSGPTGVGKTTLMNAHIPFIPYDDRPISIDEGSREVRLPHETGVSLKTRDHQEIHKRMTMADLMTESNYLNPDVEIIAEINTPESFATFGEIMSTGHGIVGTTHAATIERLVNRVIEQGLPSYLLSEIDLVVFPRHVDGERYVGEVVELVSASDADSDTTTIRRADSTIHYNTILRRTPDDGFAFADDSVPGGSGSASRLGLFERLADRTDHRIEEIEASFHRKHRYVEYLVEENVTDIDALFELLATLTEDVTGSKGLQERSTRETNSTAVAAETAVESENSTTDARTVSDDE